MRLSADSYITLTTFQRNHASTRNWRSVSSVVERNFGDVEAFTKRSWSSFSDFHLLAVAIAAKGET